MASYPMPYPMRTEYNDSGPYRNPGGTMPFPQPADVPVGMWYGPRMEIPWQAVTQLPSVGFKRVQPVFEAVWSSPVYDLHPEQRSMANNRSDRSNTANPFMGTPIWGAGGGKLRVQLLQIDPVFPSFTVEAIEQAHNSDVAALETVNFAQDVTAQFTSSNASSVLRYYPAGDGAPDRYWRLNLTFLLYPTNGLPVPPALPDPLIIQAAYY